MKANKVWIYQANRKLKEDEKSRIQSKVEIFLSDWQSHGEALWGDFQILYDLFLVVMVDENGPGDISGCSIDDSTDLIKKIEKELNISLLDRNLFAYENAEEEAIPASFDQLDELVRQGEITGDTIIFNNLAVSGKEFENRFKLPFRESWHRKMLREQPVSD